MENQIRLSTQSAWTESVVGNDFRAFGEKYFDNPAGFVLDCMIWNKSREEAPTPYQLEIMQALAHYQRACVRGPHGLGKSALSAWTVWWFALTREALGYDWKIPTTASAWRQLTKYLWPEIVKWSRRINWTKIGRPEPKYKEELTSRALGLKFGQAFAVASNRSELIEGAHADHILYLFDESKIIPSATWDSAEGAMVSENALWLAVSTPGEPTGRFYEIQTRAKGYEDWWVRHVTLQEAVDANRISIEWANARLEQWGEMSMMYQNRVLGNFAQEEADSLIPLYWVELANKRYYDRISAGLGPLTQLGVDVARMGGDKTVIAKRHNMTIAPLEKHGKMDTMQTTGIVTHHLSLNRALPCVIDAIGVGAGVYDRTTEQYPDNGNIVSFHPQEKTFFRDATDEWEFADVYSAAWWNLREMLDPDNPRRLPELLALPPDEDLPAELTKPKWKTLSSGKIFVQRKEDVKEELGRSPDSADACVMCAWEGGIADMAFA